MKSCMKLSRERWTKVWISEQQLHCLVQSVYKLTLSIDVVHWLGPLRVRQVLGVSAVLLSWSIGWCRMSFFLWFFVGLFSTMILVLCTSSLSFIGCTVRGLGALDKNEIYHIIVSVTCVLAIGLPLSRTDTKRDGSCPSVSDGVDPPTFYTLCKRFSVFF